MFVNKIKNGLYLLNSRFENFIVSLAVFQILSANISIETSYFENIVNIIDYTVVLFKSNCLIISSSVKNTSTGFVNVQRNSNVTIKNSYFYKNDLLINKEMSLIMIRSNDDNNIKINIENSNFTNITGSINGSVKKKLKVKVY